MTALSVATGAALILVVLHDVFHQLIHPAGQGLLSRWVLRGTFSGLRAVSRRSHRLLSLAGPAGVSLTLLLWAALLAVGWALIYLPFLPDSFQFASGLPPSDKEGFGAALYLSLVTLSTLGYGDITPTASWLRLLSPLETLMGFALVTAVITWVLSLYPVLVRRRALAHEVLLLAEGGVLSAGGLRQLGESHAAQLLHSLARQVVTARGDLQNFSASKYFHSPDARTSLPLALPHLEQLAEASQDAALPGGVQLQGRVLRSALRDFAHTAAEEVLHAPDLSVREALAGLARYHRRTAEP